MARVDPQRAAAGLRRTGRITGDYQTRAGERVWIVAWDDGQRSPPETIVCGVDLAIGCRVQLVGGRLERLV